jgi:hypothetical protein
MQASGFHKPQNWLGETIFFLIPWIKNFIPGKTKKSACINYTPIKIFTFLPTYTLKKSEYFNMTIELNLKRK